MQGQTARLNLDLSRITGPFCILRYNKPMQIVYGILAIIAGTLMLKYNYQLVNLTGRQDWIESKLGSGTTYFAYKLLAIFVVIMGILVVTGLATPFLLWLLSPLQHLFNFNQN